MFEYLMPSLVMRAPAGSLLDEANRLVVKRQIAYGRELGVPWGISESQFNARDLEATYQYSSFGVPDLGYKRGLGENIVIAPYATGLAAMIEPAEAARNFRRIAREGGRGSYGFYEALDYTPGRVPEGAKVGIVRAYMAHHQAMTIVGISDVIATDDMRERFHSEPIVQATELLLQERMPRDIAVARPPAEKEQATAKLETIGSEIQRRYKSPHSRIPVTQLLSNGTYAVMVTGAGSGYSRWRNIDVTRWREDVTCDSWGSFIYLRDTRSGEVWSAGYQPTGVEPDDYEVAFSEGRAEFIRHDGTLKTTLEVAVSSEHDIEVRRIDITNLGSRMREIELTSYAELALAPHGEDAAHPAFAKLFVQTEFVPGANTILATRRRKSADDAEVWAAHTVSVEGEWDGSVQFETDRARFLGRGRRVREPSCLIEGWPLSNSQGAVLDPIFSLRCRVRIPKGATARISFWTTAADTREGALDFADRHREASAFDRVITLAWTQAQGHFHYLGIGPEEANLYQRIANRVLYSDPTLRPSQEVLKRGGRNVSMLWPHGISGDLPIVLLRIDDIEQVHMVRQLLRAFEYWRLKRLAVDLVILNERASSYLQDLQTTLSGLVRPIQARPKAGHDDVAGAVYVLRADLISPEVRDLLQTAARVVLFSRRGPLSEQIKRIEQAKQPILFQAALLPAGAAPAKPVAPRPALEFFNGLGGFDSDGKEYVTFLDGDAVTPAPWVNVVCNPSFGFVVSTAGAGFTWAANSQQNRLTPWSNDPVSDSPGEAIFLRDEESAELWCPTSSPIHDPNASYTVRHGRGYTRFEHDSRGLALDLLQYVSLDDPVKISRLKITNHSRRARNLSVTAYAEWVLGFTRERSAPYVVTEIDHETGAMFARNPLSNEFGARVAFIDLDGRQNSWTGDRTEFLGRNGTLSRPVALLRGTKFSNRTGAGYDPCGALQTTLRLKSGESIEIVTLLGQATSATEAQSLIAKYRTADLNQIFGAVTQFWDDTLGRVQIKTPDRALDLLVNHWIPYQTIACRVWARSGFYQSSGAYGFRDQLQDSSSLCCVMPEIAREHLLRAASRQFLEGDVQHWWLPETGRGVRTRVSDDRIWLPYITCHYVDVTGDKAVLDEKVPFLEGPALREGERDAFFQPPISEKKASLFEHCALALDTALDVGAHGLPLMGTGDWNDGMNRVGEQGRGESVWLGWFLYATLVPFADIAEARGEAARAAKWRAHAAALKTALDEAWDGDWYRRAYFDDGTPLGSVANSECRIDSIAQSWSVISGAGEQAKSVRAMAAVEKYLVKREEGLVLLFTPPFEKALPDPGYIKGYPPGIRENGGQYTHAALWAALACANSGEGDKAHEILAMVNPINHAASNAAIHRYKVEPYVVAADVYSVAPHIGRGGWTWYTGSAGWLYRVALEALLGFKQHGDKFVIDPCIPRHWPGFELTLRFGETRYLVSIENPRHVNRGVAKAEFDSLILTSVPPQISLRDDGTTHRLKVTLG
jgi:cyclic beta-1,2-glucan synthetase